MMPEWRLKTLPHQQRIKELEQELEKANLDKDFMCSSIEAMEKKLERYREDLEYTIKEYADIPYDTTDKQIIRIKEEFEGDK